MKKNLMILVSILVIFFTLGTVHSQKPALQPQNTDREQKRHFNNGPDNNPEQGEMKSTIKPKGTDSNGNVIYGNLAGDFLTGGNDGANDNSLFGNMAGYQIDKGSYNTCVGYAAGWNIKTHYRNTFVGSNSGLGTKGNDNTFVGNRTGGGTNPELNTGSGNTFMGSEVGWSNTSGLRNTFVGTYSGRANTEGKYNTFIGYETGLANTYSESNTFVGDAAGKANTVGYYNTFIGEDAGNKNTVGSSNTFVGENAGFNNAEGSGNVFIGKSAGYSENGNDKLYIDNSIVNTPLIWGDFANNNIIIYGGFKSFGNYGMSDRRLKKNIAPLKSPLDKVSGLQGVTFEWKEAQWLNDDLRKTRQIGLVAQDVEKNLPELVSEDLAGYKAVSYTKLTAVLVEAVKELKNKVERQQAEIEILKAQLESI